jgi:hypothetical protein
MAVGVPKIMVCAITALSFITPALAQNSDTNQDDPVRITKCAWLATPVKDDTMLILGAAWAGRGQDAQATRKKAAQCMHLAPEAVSLPNPCPGGMIGVMSDQHFTPCN